MNGNTNAMEYAPDDESPACAVPDAAYHKYYKNIDQRPFGAFSTSSQWDIEVLGKEPVERDMPTFPKLAKTLGTVWRVKVERQINIEHPSYADGHVAVTAEVEVKLNRVRKGNEPRLGHGEVVYRHSVAGIGENADGVGYNDFLYESKREDEETIEDVLGHWPVVGPVGKLGQHLLGKHNGARYQLGKEGHEVAIVEKMGQLVAFCLVGVDYKGHLLEGEKTDAEWQQYVFEKKGGGK